MVECYFVICYRFRVIFLQQVHGISSSLGDVSFHLGAEVCLQPIRVSIGEPLIAEGSCAGMCFTAV